MELALFAFRIILPREVAFVENLGFNLLSVSQLLKDGYEVIFKRGSSRVLDSRGDLICWMLPF